ncbi:hypothetical protein J2X65_005193 [Ancylobacter sp. 3268]|nr:hypothetical protein [Ancylobacter sp. 3268]MDR6955810.1 hypothetical protein [Ancylobacter sp. 3268]
MSSLPWYDGNVALAATHLPTGIEFAHLHPRRLDRLAIDHGRGR